MQNAVSFCWLGKRMNAVKNLVLVWAALFGCFIGCSHGHCQETSNPPFAGWNDLSSFLGEFEGTRGEWIGLTDDQVVKLRLLAAQHREFRQYSRNLSDSSKADAVARVELSRLRTQHVFDLNDKLAAVLLPHQIQLNADYSIYRSLGNGDDLNAMSSHPAFQQLNLTESERMVLSRVQAELTGRLKKNVDEYESKLQALVQESQDRSRAVLTHDQAENLEKLIGDSAK